MQLKKLLIIGFFGLILIPGIYSWESWGSTPPDKATKIKGNVKYVQYYFNESDNVNRVNSIVFKFEDNENLQRIGSSMNLGSSSMNRNFIIDTNQEFAMSTLLTAQSTGKTVIIWVDNDTIENINKVRVIQIGDDI